MYSHIFKNHVTVSGDVPDIHKKRAEVDDSKKFVKELGALKYGLYQQDKIVAAREEARFQRTGVRKNMNVKVYGSLSDMLAEVDEDIQMSVKNRNDCKTVKLWGDFGMADRMKLVRKYMTMLSGGLGLSKADCKVVLAHVKSLIEDTLVDDGNVEYDAELGMLKNLGVSVELDDGRVIDL